MMRINGLYFLALALALAAPSCRLFHRTPRPPPASPPPKPAVFAPAPQPVPQPEQAPKPAEEALTAPPALPPGQPALDQQPPLPQTPAPQPPGTRRGARAPARPAAPESAADTVAEAPKPAPPLPRLQQILTPEQQRQCNEIINQSLARAQRILAAFEGRRGTPEQSTSILRIRTFMQQAEHARKTDLLTARALAERADVLAQDLLKSAP